MIDRNHIARVKRIKDYVLNEFDSGDWEFLATYLGDKGNIISSHPRLLRSLHFGDEDYAACVGDVLGKLLKEEPEVLDLLEGMVNEKGSESTVVSADSLDEIFPSTDVAPSSVDMTLATAMMPFAHSFDEVRDVLKSACSNAGLDLKAADDVWENTILIKDIFKLISDACIVIVDFTGKNPNVMYETGIAHALRKEVIPIAQSIDDVPFDLKHHRVLVYNNNADGRKKLQQELESRIKTIQKNHGWQPLFF
ncbi:hypothetical protein [Bifidobacterium magnum]|uniref:Putative DNA primase (DnaG) n=1 Tax=Bifidobacterium magnum TaxID=1692 RepID=A0A087BE75_9BIFI|nr:hypothetical protein [Bifidobacterium magnum]KFI69325.1 putative DNA primase (DnaG) [Bifidobacterium magnum]